jgi:thiosulfate/3-mercaptopyruvate sulfurtransferase
MRFPCRPMEWPRAALLLVAGFLVLSDGEARLLDASRPADPGAMLIEPKALQRKLEQPGLRILDTRPHLEYGESHIPGAVWVSVKTWQELGKKEGGFHDVKTWGELVGQLGIGPSSQVIVYGSKLTDTARVWWTLKYLGIQNVIILDGGWQLWIKEKRPTTSQPVKVGAVRFEPRFQADRLEEIGSLKQSIRGGAITVVDARSTDEYTGKQVRGKRAGHIPGAKNLEWKELLADDGRFKSTEQLRAMFRKRGIEPEQTAVTC